ncbi:SCO family protein [Salipaludibacillus neizhouensis]|uniref:SCO family protein n=1 Tax=Salipaludibacillus neizhouensis TaxID=885475 RepID=A0A3A9K9U3_9BACI|nr:SCO family protein [Salipaludibacillus neizhouensis]RKL67312.1 SCO family protein [Salipaludibacillus neizhouensis]
MIRNRQTLFAAFLVLLFGCALFYIGTDGFKAYTAETARVIQLTDDKPEFPANVTLEDSNERTYSISEFEGKYIFITFMYTSCVDECPLLEMNMGRVYDSIPSEYMGEEIVFLSISFDPERDDPATLDMYKNHFSADGETWRMARINDQVELAALLETYGVIVIPDGDGDFAHNSAFYLVDQTGHLLDIIDYKNVELAANEVVEILENEEGAQ